MQGLCKCMYNYLSWPFLPFSLPLSLYSNFVSLFCTFFNIHLTCSTYTFWKKLTVLFSWFQSKINISLSFTRFFLCILSTSGYRAEIITQWICASERERERAQRKKFELTLMLSLKEELLLSRANIQFALFSILFTAAAVATAYALSSPPSLSLYCIQWNHTKKVKKTKITIHHRTKKKNSRFLTNNNDRCVTNMNSFFLFQLLFILYYIRILKRIAIRLYYFLKCIDKYIFKRYMRSATLVVQFKTLSYYIHYHHNHSFSPCSLSLCLLLFLSSFFHAPFDYVNVYKSVTTSTST